jgi:cell division protein ZapA
MSKPSGVTISLLDKQYQIACPDDQREELVASARYLDQQMRNIKASGKVVGLDRIAIMAALNISHELLKTSRNLKAQQEEAAVNVDGASSKRLTEKIDEALYELRQLKIS